MSTRVRRWRSSFLLPPLTVYAVVCGRRGTPVAGRLAAVRGASILRACIHKSRTIYPDGVGELRACIHKSYLLSGPEARRGGRAMRLHPRVAHCAGPKRDGVGELKFMRLQLARPPPRTSLQAECGAGDRTEGVAAQ